MRGLDVLLTNEKQSVTIFGVQNTDKVYWTISFFVIDLVQKFAGADSSIPGKLYVNFKNTGTVTWRYRSWIKLLK